MRILFILTLIFLSHFSYAKCGFNQIKNLDHLYEFVDFQKNLKRLTPSNLNESDEDGLSKSISLYKIGTIKKGSCKNSPFVILKVVESEPTKGTPSDRFLMHSLFSLMPSAGSLIPPGTEDFMGLYLSKFVITNNKIICVSDCKTTNNKFFSSLQINTFLYKYALPKQKIPKKPNFSYDPISNFFKAEGKIKIKKNKKTTALSLKPLLSSGNQIKNYYDSSQYSGAFQRDYLPFTHAKKATYLDEKLLFQIQKLPLLYESKDYGKLYLDQNRMGIIVWPDFRIIPVHLDSMPFKEGYLYTAPWKKAAETFSLQKTDLKKEDKKSWALQAKSSSSKKFLATIHEKYVENHKIVKKYNSYSSEAKKTPLSFADYMSSKPFLILEDGFGDKLLFRKQLGSVGSAAEPLIYLYANRETDVTISLDSQITLLGHYPKYDNNWQIRTQKDGSLIDLKTKKSHPYIFWEGHHGFTPEFNAGWVVDQSELSSFFDEMLFKYGLNNKEISDFKSYWLRQLVSSPFYKIRFFNQESINKVFPLHVNPSPDTVIRVHMEYEPLKEKINLPKPPLPIRPKRSGLTLVEWSGFDYSWWLN